MGTWKCWRHFRLDWAGGKKQNRKLQAQSSKEGPWDLLVEWRSSPCIPSSCHSAPNPPTCALLHELDWALQMALLLCQWLSVRLYQLSLRRRLQAGGGRKKSVFPCWLSIPVRVPSSTSVQWQHQFDHEQQLNLDCNFSSVCRTSFIVFSRDASTAADAPLLRLGLSAWAQSCRIFWGVSLSSKRPRYRANVKGH